MTLQPHQEQELALAHGSHRRLNALTGDWVLVSPQRNRRPWQGATEAQTTDDALAYDPYCYLCPGNARAGGANNPEYSDTFVFANDFPAVVPASPTIDIKADEGLFQAMPVSGEARVLCYSPRHDLGMSRMSEAALCRVVDCWAEQVAELSGRFRTVTVFENRGAAMGCSNPHPHGQVWATDHVPSEIEKEDHRQANHLRKTGRVLLDDVVKREREEQVRVVFETDEWLCFVPFWAAWPFETMLLPLRPASHLTDLDCDQKRDLALALKRLTTRYDNLFQTEFPYSMGWHGAPGGGVSATHWRLHAHFYPPLLRSATVRKFMVGYELLAEAQRDLTPETAAELLRGQDDIHYLENADG